METQPLTNHGRRGESAHEIIKIGKGSYGEVYKVGNFAIKKFNKTDLDYAVREIAIITALDHPNIVKCTEWNFEELEMKLELYEMSLYDFLKTDKIPITWAKSIILDIAIGLQYLHHAGIIHADIKPANILLRFSGSQPRAAICDFGISVVADSTINCQKICTQQYRAPEIDFFGQNLCPYNYKVDIWSLGCIIYEFVANSHLFSEREDHREAICWIMGVTYSGTKLDIANLYSLDFAQVKERIKFAAQRYKNGPWRKCFIFDLLANCIMPKMRARFGADDVIYWIETNWQIGQGLPKNIRQPLYVQPKCDPDDMTVLHGLHKNLLDCVAKNASDACLRFAQRLYGEIGADDIDAGVACVYIAAVIFMPDREEVNEIMVNIYHTLEKIKYICARVCDSGIKLF